MNNFLHTFKRKVTENLCSELYLNIILFDLDICVCLYNGKYVPIIHVMYHVQQRFVLPHT